ncbi:tyrosine-protein phosphatase non-receptor type substrate 1-like isoform X2 [Heptranchias perlo]|uniref:tyrosine-protein phosphatase non-receptor type substrate 1-like isoform X2 n=1 Tax=Heptranchias perlo TaxID=212740 RepID=UPI003559647F
MVSVSWRRRMCDSPVCRVFYMNKTLMQSPGCDSRVSITWKHTANVMHFSIRDLQVNDTDLYYCMIAFFIPPPTKEIQGNATRLIVEGSPEVEVEFLPWPENSCCIQLVCRAENFYPDNIQLSWSKEGKEGSAWINSGITITSYNNSRTSFVNISDWQKDDVYSCHVNHSSLQTPLIRRITITFDGQHEGRVYIWAVLAFLCLILVTVLGYLLSKCSRKDSEANPIYANFVDRSRREVISSVYQNSNRNSNSNYCLIGQRPLIIHEKPS